MITLSKSEDVNRRKVMSLLGAAVGASFLPISSSVHAASEGVKPVEFILSHKKNKVSILMEPSEKDIVVSISTNGGERAYYELNLSKLTDEQLKGNTVKVGDKEFTIDIQHGKITTDFPDVTISGPEADVTTQGILKKIWRKVTAVLKIIFGAIINYFATIFGDEDAMEGSARWIREGFEELEGKRIPKPVPGPGR